MDIIIVGGGKTGTHLATLLTEDGYRIRIIESRKGLMPRLRGQFGERDVILGNGADPLTLERAGILHADVVVAATGSDEVNLVVSTLAKMEYNVSRVVARVNDPANAWMFNESMGVDVGINQADILARSVQEGLDLRDVFTILRLGKDGHAVVRVEVRPGSRVVGARPSSWPSTARATSSSPRGAPASPRATRSSPSPTPRAARASTAPSPRQGVPGGGSPLISPAPTLRKRKARATLRDGAPSAGAGQWSQQARERGP